MDIQRFTGVFTALVTPFRNGSVDFDSLGRLVEAQIAAGIDGLVPVGTTGESPTLDHGEHMEVIRAVVRQARGRVPVIAGTGSNSTREAVELTRLAHEAGVSGMLVVTPYYNKPSQEGLEAHYRSIAEATDLPIVLYSIPSRCVIEIGIPLMRRLLKRHPNINHIKEAGGSCDRVDQIREEFGSEMTILSGDDSLTLPFLSLGAEGVISVASNALPNEIVAMVRAARSGQRAEALRWHHQLYPLFKALFLEPNPVPVKSLMTHLGIIDTAEVRLPLCSLRDETWQAVLHAARRLAAPHS